MKNLSVKSILHGLVLMMMVSLSHAAPLTPETYVGIDVNVREATLDGMAKRAQLLSGGQSTRQQEDTLDQANRRQIDRIYKGNGTTAALHAAYGTRHAAEIAAWLDAHPDRKHHYALLANQFESLSRQLDGLRKGR